MSNRMLLAVYVIGICIGGIAALYGLAIFIDVRPGGRLFGTTGLLLGLGTAAAGWSCVRSNRARDVCGSNRSLSR